MKKTLTLVAISSFVLTVDAQQPANPGFENWTASILYEDCPPFLTTAQQTYFTFGNGNVHSVPSPVQGTYAAHLETYGMPGDTSFGGIFLGTPSPNGLSGGIPFTERPDSLVFWAKTNVMPGDTANVVVATKFMTNMMGYSFGYLTGTSAGWNRYAFPFTYLAPVNPDSLGMIITSSNLNSNGSGYPGSWIEIDSIQLIGATQQVPNNVFETWAAHVVNEPDNWTTLNFGNIYDGNYSVNEDNAPYFGSHDCMVKTTIAQWGDTMGYITNGRFGNNGIEGGMQVMQNPQKITGYYKYSPAVITDTAEAGAWTFHWDVGGDSAVTMEQNITALPATNVWTYFEINLTYNTWPNIDTLNIAFASSNYDGNHALLGIGSMLYIDELGVSYYPLGMDETQSSTVAVFPNPATRFLNVRLEKISAGEHRFMIYDAQGKIVKSESFNNPSQSGFYTMEVEELPSGTYTWTIDGAGEMESGSFIKL